MKIHLAMATIILAAPHAAAQHNADKQGRMIISYYEEGKKGEVLTFEPGSSRTENITQNPQHADNFPSWSPDGSKVAFNSHRTGGWAVWVMNADGSDPERLVKASQRTLNPMWSPDGKRLTFFGDKSGYWNIGIADADGRHLRWLTDDQNINRDPSFSPDGNRILFYSTRGTGQELDLCIMNVDGSEIKNITQTPEVNEFAAAYAPDGSKIACYTLAKNSEDWKGSIVVMNSDGTDRRVVAPVSGGPGKDYRDVRLAWSPDGEQIAYVEYSGTRRGRLWVVPADGTAEPRVLLELEGSINDPCWAP